MAEWQYQQACQEESDVVMQVNPSHHNDPVGPTERVRRSAVAALAASDGASFERSSALSRSLTDTPEVRREVVERARRLIEDTSYPPQVAINKIADLLAMKLAQGAQTGDSE
jgi:hypothetical protein